MSEINTGPLKVMIVDDEQEACYNLKNILLEFIDPDINILGIANSAADAEKLIKVHDPDVIFLDIEMPNENAFQFLERISPVSFEVVFVTAYDEYAVKAFKLNAVDYILKPISISELATAVDKAKEQISFKKLISGERSLYANIAQLASGTTKPKSIILKDNNNLDVVPFDDLMFVEAMGSYSKIFFLKDGIEKQIIMSRPIAEYEDMLPEDFFFRVHKTFLVNCSHITSVLKDNNYVLKIRNKFTVPVGRRRYQELMQYLKTKGFA